jgi:colicin import membrane protein
MYGRARSRTLAQVHAEEAARAEATRADAARIAREHEAQVEAERAGKRAADAQARAETEAKKAQVAADRAAYLGAVTEARRARQAACRAANAPDISDARLRQLARMEVQLDAPAAPALPPARACTHCGGAYHTNWPTQLYCGARCSMDAKARRSGRPTRHGRSVA